MNLEGQTPAQLGSPVPEALELADRWILSRLHSTATQVIAELEAYGLGEGARLLYSLIWDDFCDWYIELVKPRLRGENLASKRTAQQVLAIVLETILKLLHPWMPHITEEIWQLLTQVNQTTSISVQPYPTPDPSLDRPPTGAGVWLGDPNHYQPAQPAGRNRPQAPAGRHRPPGYRRSHPAANSQGCPSLHPGSS